MKILNTDIQRRWIIGAIVLLAAICCVPALFGKKNKVYRANHTHNVTGVVSYKKEFNDLNDTQLEAARRFGVRPVKDRKEAENLKKQLTELKDTKWYVIDNLTHSIPFLVPSAADLLQQVGTNFSDSLSTKGLNPYRLIVTSVLRTEGDVKRLRRRNRNASKNSCHTYGTTFDITYKRFDKVFSTEGEIYEDVRPEVLKKVLAEVLRDLKGEHKCYVKHEVKQGCFHITVRY